MKFRYIIASLAIHAAIIGPVVGVFHLRPSPDPNPQQPVPIFFEIVEEALPSVSDEQSGTVPMPPKETVPEDIPEDMGTVPEDMGTVPDENTEKYKIPDANTGEMADKNNDVEHAKVVSDPVALNKIIPVYPRSARRKGHEGCVTVEILVSEDGFVSGAEIVSSSGHAELDSAALGAVRTTKFAPATEDGASVTGRLRLTFNFKLE